MAATDRKDDEPKLIPFVFPKLNFPVNTEMMFLLSILSVIMAFCNVCLTWALYGVVRSIFEKKSIDLNEAFSSHLGYLWYPMGVLTGIVVGVAIYRNPNTETAMLCKVVYKREKIEKVE